MWMAAAVENPSITPISIVVVVLEWMTFFSTQMMSKSENWKKRVVMVVEKKEEEKKEKKEKKEKEKEKKVVEEKEKEKEEKLPHLVTYFFSNNFVNPLGILGIGGIFFCPLFLYVRSAAAAAPAAPAAAPAAAAFHIFQYDFSFIFQIQWEYVGWLLYLGRFVAAWIECYFCHKYLTSVVREEDKENEENEENERETNID